MPNSSDAVTGRVLILDFAVITYMIVYLKEMMNRVVVSILLLIFISTNCIVIYMI